jgi:hypothetical protein
MGIMANYDDDVEGPFWAGGSATPGWFVKFRREGTLHDPEIKWFFSKDYPDGEKEACHRANALASRLNDAFLLSDY